MISSNFDCDSSAYVSKSNGVALSCKCKYSFQQRFWACSNPKLVDNNPGGHIV